MKKVLSITTLSLVLSACGSNGSGSSSPDTSSKSGVYHYSGVSFGANSEGKLSFNADFVNKQANGAITERKLLSNNHQLPSIELLPTTIERAGFAGQK